MYLPAHLQMLSLICYKSALHIKHLWCFYLGLWIRYKVLIQDYIQYLTFFEDFQYKNTTQLWRTCHIRALYQYVSWVWWSYFNIIFLYSHCWFYIGCNASWLNACNTFLFHGHLLEKQLKSAGLLIFSNYFQTDHTPVMAVVKGILPTIEGEIAIAKGLCEMV